MPDQNEHGARDVDDAFDATLNHVCLYAKAASTHVCISSVQSFIYRQGPVSAEFASVNRFHRRRHRQNTCTRLTDQYARRERCVLRLVEDEQKSHERHSSENICHAMLSYPIVSEQIIPECERVIKVEFLRKDESNPSERVKLRRNLQSALKMCPELGVALESGP